MKKGKIKALAKTEKKILRVFLEENLIEKLKNALEDLGYDPKKVKKEILKSSKSIAKRITEKAKPKVIPEKQVEEASDIIVKDKRVRSKKVVAGSESDKLPLLQSAQPEDTTEGLTPDN